MIFWDIDFFYTPEKIFEEKIAGTLNFRNKITGEKKEIELDVDQHQWFVEDKKLWEEYFFDEMKKSSEKSHRTNEHNR